MTAASEQPGGPVGAGERLVTLDFIRGVAVLGILFANITALAQPYIGYLWPPALDGGMRESDGWVWVFQLVFVDGRFRGLFTLLFGAGIMLFMERAWARGQGRWLQFRRLAWLLLFGLIHFFLIWRGDILTLYAVWGMAALLAVRMEATKLLAIGITVFVFGQLAMAGLMGGSWLAASDPTVQAMLSPEDLAEVARASAAALAEAEREVTLYGQSSWPEIVAYSLANRGGEVIQSTLIVGLTETLGLLLVGMGLYKAGFFSGAIDTPTMRRWGWIGIIVGAVLSLPAALWVRAGGFEFFHTLFVFNGLSVLLALPMALGYAALLTVWAPRATQHWLGARVAAAGRMAFSNYIGTSLVMVAVFHGWGLGLFGELHRIELLAFVALGWVLMLAWSKWWLDRFDYGPLEWLWRSLTYWRWFPLRKRAVT
jgi:uncharacterized protein